MKYVAEFSGSGEMVAAAREVLLNPQIDMAIVRGALPAVVCTNLLAASWRLPRPHSSEERRGELWRAVLPQEDVDRTIADLWPQAGITGTKVEPFHSDNATVAGQPIDPHIDGGVDSDFDGTITWPVEYCGVSYSLAMNQSAVFCAEATPVDHVRRTSVANYLSDASTYSRQRIKGDERLGIAAVEDAFHLRSAVVQNVGDMALFSGQSVHATEVEKERIAWLGSHRLSPLPPTL